MRSLDCKLSIEDNVPLGIKKSFYTAKYDSRNKKEEKKIIQTGTAHTTK